MSASKPWSHNQIQSAIAILKRSHSVPEALIEIARRTGRNTGVTNLKDVFIKRGLDNPSRYLLVDPVARIERQEQESQLKREHAHLLAQLREAEERQGVLNRLSKPVAIQQIKRREKGSGLREGTAVILASDWHVEEFVPKRADTAGNFYDIDVAAKRAERFFTGIRWLLDHNRPVFGLRDVVLWLGGDLMTGYLRNENLEENQLSPVQTVKWLQAKLASGIDHVLEDTKVETLTIICSHGNHGRTTEKRQISTGAKNSYEWLLYQWLATHYADNPRVRFITDESNHQYLQVYNFNLHFTHGDEVKYAGGIGGIAVPLMKAVAGWDQVRRCDFHHMGHWHQLRDFGNVTVNGSLIGYNSYAMSVRAAPEAPQQAFYIVDSERGKTAQFPIWVAERE